MNNWPPKSLVLASDHAATELRKHLCTRLHEQGIDVLEIGPDNEDSVDYAETSAPAAALVCEGVVEAGILLCGSGIGQSITANRFTGIRAALVHSVETAELCRQHNDANILVLGARVLDRETAVACVEKWLATSFEGGRHERRTGGIDATTQNYPWLSDGSLLSSQDPELFSAITKEQDRQEFQLEMIASENVVSPAVLQAAGTVLTNKYAEGYPEKRYYGGCEFVDVAEQLAIDRACQLFGASFANVQPHSGSQANMAAYMALVKPGSKILGMSLSHGGHLTHGAKVNFSGQFFVSASYEIDSVSGLIDYDAILKQAQDEQPDVLVAGASAYPRTLDFKKFREIADKVGAKLLVDMAHIAGLVAAGLHPTPVGIADIVTSTTHKTLRGPRGGLILATEEEYFRPINSKIFPGIQGGPLMHIIAAKAVAFKEALAPEFAEYMAQVKENAAILAEVLIARGYKLVSGGTDNHLILIDFGADGISGKDAEAALEDAGITVNKNTVPQESRSPFVTSGIRVGTPAITSRGIGAKEMRIIAGWMADVLDAPSDSTVRDRVKKEIRELCLAFPLYRYQDQGR